MEIRVRLHPSLRAQLRKLSPSRHQYGDCLARIAAQVRRIVARHGPEITYAAVTPLAAPPDEAGCAMSVFRSRHGAAIADVDPIGTAIGEAVIVARPGARRLARGLKPAGGARHNGYTHATLRLGPRRPV
jgi:hypothetical protein